MSGEDLKSSLDGLTKIDNFSGVLWNAMYWIAVMFVLLLIAYVGITVSLYISSRRKGIPYKDEDDFLSD